MASTVSHPLITPPRGFPRGMMLALVLSLAAHVVTFWQWRVTESRGVTALPTLEVRINVTRIAEATPEAPQPVMEQPPPRPAPQSVTETPPPPGPAAEIPVAPLIVAPPAPEPDSSAAPETATVRAIPPEPVDENEEPTVPVLMASAPVRAAPALAPDPVKTADIEARYKAELAAAIASHRHYPPFSRRMREQGTVTVAFTVHRDGLITDVRIERSSGHPRLDEAALDAVRAVGRFHPIPARIARESWAFVIPVEYRLT